MSPILGIWASAAQPPLYASSFDSIATVTVGAGGSSSITFSSIPSTYKHLQIRFIARSDRAVTATGIAMRVGTGSLDTTSSYADHKLEGDGSSVTAGSDTSVSYMFFPRLPAASTTASVFAGAVIDVLDYQNTNKYKTIRSLAGFDANGSGYIALASGLWQKSTAIDTISIYSDVSGNLTQYSQIALYGVKG